MNCTVNEESAKLQLKQTDPLNGKHYLFVCTGNSCRSPMAEALFNKKYGQKGYSASSAGLCASGSADISTGAKAALLKIGIEDFSHVPQNVSDELVRRADKVIGITKNHSAALIMAFPQFATKISSMPVDIPDPYGGSEKDYSECLEMIDKALDKLMSDDEGN